MNRNVNVYQVSQLTEEMRRLMETSYPEIWIEGELSSLSTPASGHLYFSLKDERSQLRCAMFKGRASISRYQPRVGDLVRVRAKISVYAARGDLQCIVQHIEEAGEGVLQRRFEELKAALSKEGLFDQSHKKALPAYPQHIGIVSSPSGAAVRDIISTLKRRCPGIPVTVYPAVVQGDTAAQSISSAIRDTVQHQLADVIILSRGGGSLEDLWCFNNEDLAREINQCPIPIVSGVGHEVDVTISDLVADLRAPTPTAAAELVSPDTEQLSNQLMSLQYRLPRSFERLLQRQAQQVDMLSKQLIHPNKQLRVNTDKLTELGFRLKRSIHISLERQRLSVTHESRRLNAQNPARVLTQNKEQLQQLAGRLRRVTSQQINGSLKKLEGLGGQLNMVSPLATLERGFAIARDSDDKILRTSENSKVADEISLMLGDGSLDCKIIAVHK